jgi:hypothetical protein
VRRRLPELGEPKVTGLKGCPTAGTLLGTVSTIAPDRPAVVVEGVADALTAALGWPEATVLGAHGACNLPAVAQVAARIAVRRRARLVLVPHNDRTGHDAAVEASLGKTNGDSGGPAVDRGRELGRRGRPDWQQT